MTEHSFHSQTTRLDFRIIEAMPGISALILADASDFTVVAASDEFANSAGMVRNELVGKSFFDSFLGRFVVSENTRSDLWHSFQNVLVKKQMQEVPMQRYSIVNANGSVTDKYWLVQNKAILDEAGETQYILFTAKDLTEQIKTEIHQERIKEIEKVHHLFLQAPVAICIVSGPNYVIELVNERMLQFLGRTASIIGKPIENTLTESRVQGLTAILDSVYKTKKPSYVPGFRAEILIDGVRQERYFDLIFKPYFLNVDKEQPSGIFCVAHNVTEQVLARHKVETSEAALQQKVQERTADLEHQNRLLDNILRHSSNGISVSEVIRDEQGNVIDARTMLANDAAVNFIGLPVEIYLSKTAVELDPNIIGSPYYQMCLHTLDTGEPSLTQYFFEQTGRWLELTISRMDSEHLIHIFTDVTSIKESQLQLERTVDDLKRSNSNLEEFAYAASHDLKEPIRKIQLFADRLKNELKGNLTETQDYLFNRMEKAAGRMSLLVDDLLTYSHVNMGVGHIESVDLNKKVQQVLEDLELQIQEKDATITVDPLPVITAHRRQIQQLFQNLIGNALKYSKPDVPPKIHISSQKIYGSESGITLSDEEKQNLFYLIEIRDNGIGFDPEDAGRIFNVFTRLHGNKEYSGTGVGLSIVRKVVENHKGHVWAESQAGEGAVFKILLPVN